MVALLAIVIAIVLTRFQIFMSAIADRITISFEKGLVGRKKMQPKAKKNHIVNTIVWKKFSRFEVLRMSQVSEFPLDTVNVYY